MTTLRQLQTEVQDATSYEKLCDILDEAGESFAITEAEYDALYEGIMRKINKCYPKELEKASDLILACDEVKTPFLQTCSSQALSTLPLTNSA